MPYGGRLSKVIVQQNVYLFQQRWETLLLGCHLIRCRYTCQKLDRRCVEPKHLLAWRYTACWSQWKVSFFFDTSTGWTSHKFTRCSDVCCSHLSFTLAAGPAAMAKDPLAEAGFYFDELNKLRVLEPDVSQRTSELKEECKEFVDSEQGNQIHNCHVKKKKKICSGMYIYVLFCFLPRDRPVPEDSGRSDGADGWTV